MAKIEMSTWKEFRVGDLFTATRGRSRYMQVLGEGNVPVIAAGRSNQGIAGYYDVTVEYENAITISCNGVGCGSTYYHDYPFAITGDAIVLQDVNPLSANVKRFISTVYDSYFTARYSYAEKCSPDKAMSELIKLPATLTGEPDWDYMDNYMSNMTKTTETVFENLMQIDDNKHLLDVSEWREFIIGELFEKLQLDVKKEDFNKTFDVSEERTDEFNLPLVNAKHGNNGIMYYGRESDFETAEMTIDIVQNGAIATGDVYAQPQKTGVLWDAYLVKPKAKIGSAFTLMFLATVLEKAIKDKFSYDDKCVWDKVKLLAVTLPCTSDNEPDWAYMDEYMRKVVSNTQAVLSAIQAIS